MVQQPVQQLDAHGVQITQHVPGVTTARLSVMRFIIQTIPVPHVYQTVILRLHALMDILEHMMNVRVKLHSIAANHALRHVHNRPVHQTQPVNTVRHLHLEQYATVAHATRRPVHVQ